MKRRGNLIELISNPDNLRLAFWKASKGKRGTTAVLQYQKSLDSNLMTLREQILSGQVKVGNYRVFTIFEPKERKICASAFEERVLQHALMNICHETFERHQLGCSYASRVGKGVHAALERSKHYQKRNAWFLKLDIKKFFDSVHHPTLIRQLHKLFKDQKLLSIFEQIIMKYPTYDGRGLPIGNLTSQYFANHFLSPLDKYIKEKLCVGSYVRYMDDMVLWHTDKQYLLEALKEIRYFIENELNMELKPYLLNRTVTGLPFLGYHIFPHHVALLQNSKRRFIKKMSQIETMLELGAYTQTDAQRHVLPLINFTRYADTKTFRKNLLLRMVKVKGSSV